jgi:hypothetical protein
MALFPSGDLRKDFEEWYAAYPRKKAPLAAEKAYRAARKRGATREQLLNGIAGYIRSKPSWQAFAYPASWLNAGRYLDQEDAEIAPPSEAPKPYVPPAYRPYVPLADRLKREAGN